MIQTFDAGCRLCVDLMMPAGIHSILGPIYRTCPACTTGCGECDGRGVFPASGGLFEHLANALDALGFDIDLCRNCLGVTAVHPRTRGATA